MRLSKHKSNSSLSFNMTPMIDIVFLLIIFFMTVSQITRSADLPLPLPRVTSGDVEVETASLTINLDQNGMIVVGGQEMSLSAVIIAIQQKLTQFDNDPKRLRIQIRCDRHCECRHVSNLLKSLSEIGFTNVRSAVESSREIATHETQ